MKTRWCLGLLFALVLGALVNVAVAWACTALTLPSERWNVEIGWIDGQPWAAGKASRPGAVQFMSLPLTVQDVGDATTQVSVPAWSRARDPLSTGYALEDARGWPMLALRCSFAGSRPANAVIHDGFVVGRGRPSPVVRGELWTLPHRPMMPGFLVNTAFYWLVVVVLWRIARPGAPRLRQSLRRRRGQCTVCGYPLRSGPRCPECGAASTPAAEMR